MVPTWYQRTPFCHETMRLAGLYLPMLKWLESSL
nr:MAG TPA: hypothetical protein [Caudoviricetes sp.]